MKNETEYSYRYTTIFSIKGISLSDSHAEQTIIDDSEKGVHVFITRNIDKYTYHDDEYIAVSGLLLKGKVNSEEQDNYINNYIEEAKNKRKKIYRSNPLLVIIKKGKTYAEEITHKIEAEEFIACFEELNHNELKSRFDNKINALLCSIISETESVIGVNRVSTSFVFFKNNDNKPIYSYGLSGSFQAYESRSLDKEKVTLINNLYHTLLPNDKLMHSGHLRRIQGLIRTSFESEDNSFKAFINAWWAFEKLINNIADEYDEITKIAKDKITEKSQKKILITIDEIKRKNNKYPDEFAIKFSKICFTVSPNTCDEDLKIMLKSKKIRNNLLHGEQISDSELPVRETQMLASKYLRLHFNYKMKKNHQLSEQW